MAPLALALIRRACERGSPSETCSNTALCATSFSKKLGTSTIYYLKNSVFACQLDCNHPKHGNRGTGGALRTHNGCFLERFPMSLNRRHDRQYPSPSQGEFSSSRLPRLLASRPTSHPVAVILLARDSATSAPRRASAAFAQPVSRRWSSRRTSPYRDLSPVFAALTDSVYKFSALLRSVSYRRYTADRHDRLRISLTFSVSCASPVRKPLVFNQLCIVWEKISLRPPSACLSPMVGLAPRCPVGSAPALPICVSLTHLGGLASVQSLFHVKRHG